MAIAGTRVQGSGVSGVDAKVEFKLGEDDWAPVDSWATRVSVSGGDIPFSERKPFTGDPEIYVAGRNPYDIEVEILYTEGTTDPFYQLFTAALASNDVDLDVRWVPKGDGSGGLRFASSGGKLGNMLPPSLDSEADAPAALVVPIRAAAIAVDTES